MSLIKYNPGDYRPVSFNSLIDRFFNDSFVSNETAPSFTPQVDIAETDKNFEIQFAVPGMDKKDFHIDINDGVLTVSGERKFEETKKEKNFHSVESYFGTFKRSFNLPDNVKEEKIEAKYENGILIVDLPKSEVKKEIKTISIK